MRMIIAQQLTVLPDKVHVLVRLVDADTGEVLHEFAKTYHGWHVDDAIHDSLEEARTIGRNLGARRFIYRIA